MNEATMIIADWMNTGEFPTTIKNGREIVFSKNSSTITTTDQTRLINVNSHLIKIVEKAILKIL